MLTPEALDYLHDADLLKVQIDYTPTERSLTFTAKFHPDCGNEDLNDRTVVVKASGIVLLSCRAYGYMEGQESVNWCELKVSGEIDGMLSGWYDIGGKKPPGELTLVTHSGSVWAMMFESLSVRLQT